MATFFKNLYMTIQEDKEKREMVLYLYKNATKIYGP